jgi:hypothetical protein
VAQHLDPAKIVREQFPLGSLAARLEALARKLDSGIGFGLIRGIPIERYSVQEASILLCGVGAHFGRQMAQDARGGVINHVRDAGPASPGGEYTRGYRSCLGLPFHSDSCDIVALLCIRAAMSGGLSSIASSYAIHNAILEVRPDLLPMLYEPFHIDRHVQGLPRTTSYYSTPVFMLHRGRLFCRFNPGYVYSAQRYVETPRLTERQAEAIEIFMQLCSADTFRLDMELELGDLQLLNNNVIVHSRTAYQDPPEITKKRYLLRLWLFTSGIDDLPVPMRDRYRDMESWQVNAHVQTCD